MKRRILVAPLNWGLGHTTRCIPIIKALIEHQFEPIIASDGASLELLKKEFPSLICIDLPSYHITYSKNGLLLKWKLLKNVPTLLKAIKREKKVIKTIIKTHQIDGIISDNRFGVFSKQIPSVYITHQLHVLSGNTTWLTTKIHQHIIKKYNECWIPDVENNLNLSGKLGHLKIHNLNLNYLGILSRFSKIETPLSYNIMVLLSGPEPQRTLLEEKLMFELKPFNGQILLIKGLVEKTQTITKKNNLTIYNYMQSTELEKAIQSSHLIISRSGYTTIMDLAALGRKSFFIPTPGQFEQVYLAKRLESLQIAPYCKQHEFSMDKLKSVTLYKGFKGFENEVDFKKLFRLFRE